MEIKKIHTDKAPAAIGPYSQAVMCGDVLYTSGQVPIDPTSGEVVTGDITQQTLRSVENVGAILNAAGLGFEDVIKTTCFLADMGDFAAFNAVYEKYFVSLPARSCVAVKTLPRNVLCEIEAIAAKKD